MTTINGASMKNYIKAFLIFSILSVSSITLCMEEKKRKLENPENVNQEEPENKKLHIVEKFLQDLGLPNEMWALILDHVYLNASILDEGKDIFEGIERVKEHIAKCHNSIPYVCKGFKDLNIAQEQWNELKEKFRKFYIAHLNERFLEKHEAEEGLFLKNDTWLEDKLFNQAIGIFVSTGELNLFDLLNHLTDFETIEIKTQNLIKLLVFYINPETIDQELISLLKNLLNQNLSKTDLEKIKLQVLNYQYKKCQVFEKLMNKNI